MKARSQTARCLPFTSVTFGGLLSYTTVHVLLAHIRVMHKVESKVHSSRTHVLSVFSHMQQPAIVEVALFPGRRKGGRERGPFILQYVFRPMKVSYCWFATGEAGRGQFH